MHHHIRYVHADCMKRSKYGTIGVCVRERKREKKDLYNSNSVNTNDRKYDVKRNNSISSVLDIGCVQ